MFKQSKPSNDSSLTGWHVELTCIRYLPISTVPDASTHFSKARSTSVALQLQCSLPRWRKYLNTTSGLLNSQLITQSMDFGIQGQWWSFKTPSIVMKRALCMLSSSVSLFFPNIGSLYSANGQRWIQFVTGPIFTWNIASPVIGKNKHHLH